MKRWLSIGFIAVFVCYSCYGLVVASSLFDLAWLLAILTIPTGNLFHFFFHGIDNIYIQISLLIIAGIIQYGLIGYFLGAVIEWIKGTKNFGEQNL